MFKWFWGFNYVCECLGFSQALLKCLKSLEALEGLGKCFEDVSKVLGGLCGFGMRWLGSLGALHRVDPTGAKDLLVVCSPKPAQTKASPELANLDSSQLRPKPAQIFWRLRPKPA